MFGVVVVVMVTVLSVVFADGPCSSWLGHAAVTLKENVPLTRWT